MYSCLIFKQLTWNQSKYFSFPIWFPFVLLHLLQFLGLEKEYCSYLKVIRRSLEQITSPIVSYSFLELFHDYIAHSILTTSIKMSTIYAQHWQDFKILRVLSKCRISVWVLLQSWLPRPCPYPNSPEWDDTPHHHLTLATLQEPTGKSRDREERSEWAHSEDLLSHRLCPWLPPGSEPWSSRWEDGWSV